MRPAGAVASSSSRGLSLLVQQVDLVVELQLRGLPTGTACAALDASPPLLLEVRSCVGEQPAQGETRRDASG